MLHMLLEILGRHDCRNLHAEKRAVRFVMAEERVVRFVMAEKPPGGL
jgi:hypothetical protein